MKGNLVVHHLLIVLGTLKGGYINGGKERPDILVAPKFVHEGAEYLARVLRALSQPPANDKLAIAETQLGLADLSLEEARPPAEQEAATRQALEVFQAQKVRDDETGAWCVLARALIAQGKVAAAKDAVQHARSLSAKSQNPGIRWQTGLTAAQIEIADKDLPHSAGIAASKELAAIITKARELGYAEVELEARLALAEIEMKTGQATVGRAHLTAIEADAKAKGCGLVARKADAARSARSS